MNMAFDLENTGPGRGEEDRRRAGAPPSWPDLVARMVAAREASGSLGRELRSASPAGSGSFDEAAAAVLAVLGARRVSVNPNDLGNRKPGGATSLPAAGQTSAGGRGKP